MAKVTVKVTGLKELGENIKLLQEDMRERVIFTAARRAGVAVRDQAKANAEAQGLRDTGALIAAIDTRKMTKLSKGGKAFYAVGVFKVPGGEYANTRANRRAQRVGKEYKVDPPEFYWKFHEFGTVKMPARPFLVPAFDAKKAVLPDVMKVAIERGIKRAERKLKKGKT